MHKPIICCLNGHATAAGIVLALYCDYVISKPSVKVGTTEAKHGLNVGEWAYEVVARITGHQKAGHIFQTAGLFSAKEGVALG